MSDTITIPIPQPKTLPILGNLLNVNRAAPVQSLVGLARKHGPIFRLTLAGRPRLFLSSQELVNEVCDERRFVKLVHPALERIRPLTGDGLFTAYNEEPSWALAHQLLMPAFGPLGVRGMFGRMLDIAEQMLLHWERFGSETDIHVCEDMTRLTLDTLGLCAFDYRFNSFYRETMHPFVEAMVGALRESSSRSRRPAFATRLMFSTRRRFDEHIRYMHGLADDLVEQRRRAPQPDGHDDLLSIMLKGRDPETGEGLSSENIRFQMVTFLLAGHETTSGLLSFALDALLRNPAVMEKAHAQVDTVLGGRTPEVGDLAALGYLEQILFETLRLWPSAPVIGLQALEPTTIGGRYAVTPAEPLLVLLPALHRDPAVWQAPEDFRPERFAPGEVEKLPPNAWKPFGNGQRACIGRTFALQEAQLVLTLVLQRFELLAAGPAGPLKVAETLSMKPDGFTIRVRRREPVKTPGDAARRLVAKPPSEPPAPTSLPSPVNSPDLTPLLVLYGSNSGSSETFARRIAEEAAGRGYHATLETMNAYADQSLPTEGAVLIVTASYGGQPPKNARKFLAWIETPTPPSLAGVRYAVFGCGDRHWAKTYQAVPKRVDEALSAAGATRLSERGETDAGSDLLGGFERWRETFWRDLHAAGGQRPEPSPASDAGCPFHPRAERRP